MLILESDSLINLCIEAMSAPVIVPCESISEAQRLRFHIYNGFRQLTRNKDNRASYKDLIEVLVREDANGARLVLQRKGGRLSEIFSRAGLNADGTRPHAGEAPTQSLYEHKAAVAALPTVVEQADDSVIAELELSEWLNEYFDGDKDEILQARAAWYQLDKPPLESFQKLVREKKPRG